MDRLISSNQSAFIKGRYILESVVVAHGAIHSLSNSGSKWIVLNLDYEKAFDKVNVDLLEELLTKRGLSSKWIGWIHKITARGGSIRVKLNNLESNFFSNAKGLKQGDPLSPLLFNLVVDVLIRMLSKAADTNLIKKLS